MTDTAYPSRLLPQPEYCYIENFLLLTDAYLMRNMPPDFLLENGSIDASKFAFQSGHLADLSTNLLGVFRPEDRKYQLTREGREKYQRPWVKGVTVNRPACPGDFRIDDKLEAVYLSIGQIAGLQVPYNIEEQEGFAAICTLVHTPIDGNFWHVSLRWINQEGDVLHQKGSWRRRMLTAARALLTELAVIEAPQDEARIDPSVYRAG